MCKPRTLFVEKRVLDKEAAPESFKRERKRLRRIFKDLSRRCVLPSPGIDLLEFLKVTELPGLLGEQFFKAMDGDEDGILSQHEFVSGFLTLYKGTYVQVAKMLCTVLDFNRKGYLTLEEMRMLAMYIPTVCQKCCNPSIHTWKIEEKLIAIFGQFRKLSYDDAFRAMEIHPEFFDLMYQSLVNSLPAVFDEAMDRTSFCDISNCRSTSSSSMCNALTVQSLKYTGKTVYFELKNGALYYYNEADRGRVKGIILLKGLFVLSVGKNEFELKDFKYTYYFQAANSQDRDDWITRIHEEMKFRLFEDYYESGEVIGEGTYGQVLKATARSTGKVAAVKVINKEPLDSKCECRLRREIDILKFIKHENILELYDVFETDDRIYLVTEYISGGPLFSWLESQNFKVPESTAKMLTLDIANALAYLHSCGIIHRDLKLENILLHIDGQKIKAKLIDFGLSCFLGPGQFSMEPVGTLKYVAPEIVSRIKYREKVDCWSLGVIIFILLRGAVPFFGKNDQEVVLRILKKKLKFDGKKWTGVSVAARTVVEGLLSRKPEHRHTLHDLLCSDWLTEDEEDTACKIAVPHTLKLTTPFQSIQTEVQL